MAAAMGFSSFGAQDRPAKKRRFNSHADAVVSGSYACRIRLASVEAASVREDDWCQQPPAPPSGRASRQQHHGRIVREQMMMRLSLTMMRTRWVMQSILTAVEILAVRGMTVTTWLRSTSAHRHCGGAYGNTYGISGLPGREDDSNRAGRGDEAHSTAEAATTVEEEAAFEARGGRNGGSTTMTRAAMRIHGRAWNSHMGSNRKGHG